MWFAFGAARVRRLFACSPLTYPPNRSGPSPCPQRVRGHRAPLAGRAVAAAGESPAPRPSRTHQVTRSARERTGFGAARRDTGAVEGTRRTASLTRSTTREGADEGALCRPKRPCGAAPPSSRGISCPGVWRRADHITPRSNGQPGQCGGEWRRTVEHRRRRPVGRSVGVHVRGRARV